jgi:glucosylglycerate synthase
LALETIPEAPQSPPQEIVHADFVIGIAAGFDPANAPAITEALKTLPGGLHILVLQDLGPSGGDVQETLAEPATTVSFMAWPAAGTDGSSTPLQSLVSAWRALFSISQKLDARGCALVASQIEDEKPGWVAEFVRPLVEANFDIVVPSYARRKLEGLLNSSIISPLTRCLYGKRIQNPMGPDLALSRKLIDRAVSRDAGSNSAGAVANPLTSLGPLALCEGFKICQVQMGPRVYPPADWTNVSGLLAQVLGPVFLEVEKNAAFWQRIRNSSPVPSFGNPIRVSQETGAVDISRLVESFQLGTRDLQEIWGVVLPPASLLELRKLSRLTPENFRLPDELWVRLIFDFALAHRLRTINRDHLLRSLTPLYLGWVASFARELEISGATGVEQRLERLALAYEEAKPYFLSRWRWPDRFNP